ncbi:MAG: phospholipase [Candidatus Kapabacteria bacterium]|nr:phospholipase [Candidatus Kapabacteria bacterium]
MSASFRVLGKNAQALFTLTAHRGDGMCLLAMDWKKGRPPKDFVGFAIEYKEPGGEKFFSLKNRLAFEEPEGAVNANTLSTRLSPIQKFRWVHFPRNADMTGEFVYRVVPVFMNKLDELSYGEEQTVRIVLHRETHPGKLNVSFTRGFVSSQAFVDRFESKGAISTLIPSKSDEGLSFIPEHPDAAFAHEWMGFEARSVLLETLDAAIKDKKAMVSVVAYELNEPQILARLEKLGSRLRIIIDDDGKHASATSAESKAAKRLRASAGKGNVKRQHMGKLQHNKTIVVNGPKLQCVLCGSTNFSWRGLYVQSNNALVLRGKKAVARFEEAFADYWGHPKAPFKKSASSMFTSIDMPGIDVSVGFAPFGAKNGMIDTIAADIAQKGTSSVMYSLAFLYQTPGAIAAALEKVTKSPKTFVYGISDRKVGGGLDVQIPDGNIAPVYPEEISAFMPEPFNKESSGGAGVRMHHKFIVIDFDKPTARVYLGSYNFSAAADGSNGENLVLIRDQRVATSYMIEAIRMIDHYHFRIAQSNAITAVKKLVLKRPPRTTTESPWWLEDYTIARKIRDRKMFAE